MPSLVRSLLRISVCTAGGLVLLLLSVGLGIRQPVLSKLPFPGGERTDAALLEGHVRFLASPEHMRSWRDPPGLERAAGYIATAFSRTGARTSEQTYRARDFETRNLVAQFGPAIGPRVVVGAHYDAFGGLPGADDNASGVAGLLELARLMGSRELSSTVELVAYSTEEPPFFGGEEMGSFVHARSMVGEDVHIRAMIALEMIGFFSDRQPRRAWILDALYPRRGDFIAIVGRWSDRSLARRVKKAFAGAGDLLAVSYSGPVILGADLSDHRNYWSAGFPAVMVTDTAYLRNPNYHRPTDVPDSLDYQRMAAVVDGVLSAVVHLAGP